MPEFERHQGQIRNALYGVNSKTINAANQQGEATVSAGHLQELINEHIGYVASMLSLFQEHNGETYQGIWTKNNVAEAFIDEAQGDLKSVMSSKAGTEVSALLAENKRAVQANAALLDGEFRNYEPIATAIDGLLSALRTKSEQIGAIVAVTTDLQNQLRETGQVAHARAQEV